MIVPTQAQLLDLWDAGANATTWRRALLLLQIAWPQDAVAQWPLGHANARLLELRAALFGSDWQCVADCPSCAQVVEATLDTATMLATAPSFESTPALAWHALDEQPSALRFRLPVVGDLVGARTVNGVGASRLLDAIIEVPASNESGAAPVDVSSASRNAIEQRVMQLDPLAAIDVVIDCPACGRRWRAAVEVAGMLWAEVAALAKRLLADVTRLAAVFGWTEAQILALSPMRRQHYLDMVREW